MTIAFSHKHVQVSLPVARALLAFAGKDPLRPHVGVGIDDGALCATNGHIAVAFETATTVLEDGAAPATQNGAVWSHAHVTSALKTARARKRQTVVLRYSDRLSDCQYPRLAGILSAEGWSVDQPIGFNPSLFAPLATLGKACGTHLASLAAAGKPLDPMVFTVGNRDGLCARAVVMPARL